MKSIFRKGGVSMRIALNLNPPRNEELRTLELSDAEVQTLLACDGIEIHGSYYKITGKVFNIGFGGTRSLSIDARQQDPEN